MGESEGTRGGHAAVEAARCALVGREEVDCACGSGEETANKKVGEGDERDARESLPHTGRTLRRGKVTGRKETGGKETGRKETKGRRCERRRREGRRRERKRREGRRWEGK